MQKDVDNKIHLVYIRFAFPFPNEPGPKRPLEIVERYQSQGHRVTVITSSCNFMTGNINGNAGGKSIRRTENGIEYIRVAAVSKYRSSMVRRLMNYALFTVLAFLSGMKVCPRNCGKTIILVDISPPFAALGGYILSRFRTKARLVLEVTDLPESVFELGMFNSPFFRWLTDRVFRHIYRVSDHIVTLTPGAERHIAGLGVARKKITTITNWVDSSEINIIEEQTIKEIRERHGWQDDFVVMYAGGHGKAYDLMTLIRAAESLKNMTGLKFVFMGEGERKKEYIQYCIERNLKSCDFIPPVPRNMLKAYLASADVCVNLFYKGDFWNKVIGHKIFDYFEAGCPIIFAGDGDTADIILRSKGGKVVQPENPEALSEAIVEMMNNMNETQQMGQRGRNYIKREFDKERLLSRLDPVFLKD